MGPKNTAVVIALPADPPAPIMPEITPRERREMNGAIPKVAPAAACRGERREYWIVWTGLE